MERQSLKPDKQSLLVERNSSNAGNCFENCRELNVFVHNKLSDKYLSKYKAINKKESQLKNLKLGLLQQATEMAQMHTLEMIDFLMAQN